jgi:hypothetical protein
MANYPVAPAPQALSGANSYTLWPGGGIPRAPPVGGGGKRKSRKVRKSKKTRKTRGHRKH